MDENISLFICGTKCDAGGTEAHGGHVFNIQYDERDQETGTSYSGYRCKCGTSNISWSMWNAP